MAVIIIIWSRDISPCGSGRKAVGPWWTGTDRGYIDECAYVACRWRCRRRTNRMDFSKVQRFGPEDLYPESWYDEIQIYRRQIAVACLWVVSLKINVRRSQAVAKRALSLWWRLACRCAIPRLAMRLASLSIRFMTDITTCAWQTWTANAW